MQQKPMRRLNWLRKFQITLKIPLSLGFSVSRTKEGVLKAGLRSLGQFLEALQRLRVSLKRISKPDEVPVVSERVPNTVSILRICWPLRGTTG